MSQVSSPSPIAGARATARLAMSIPLLLLGFADAREVAAQAEVVEGHAPSRRIESIRPRTGPAGTRVSINTGGLPAITPTRIGLGAAQFGFEEIGQELTTERGRIDMTVMVPEWAHLDRPTVFIVFDFYFRPLALSNYFHATDENGILTRRGQLIHVGEPCSVLFGEFGDVYALEGEEGDWEEGTEVVVQGMLTESSPCLHETTISVRRIQPARSGS